MSDLEQDFDQLVDEMYQKIIDRELKGELTADEANHLRRMISDRLDRTGGLSYTPPSNRSTWNDSGCSWNSSSENCYSW